MSLNAMRSIVLILLALTCSAQAETPKLFLQCDQTAHFLPITHIVVLYSQIATVDDIPYNLETKDNSFLLKAAPKIVADMLDPSPQIIIDRTTGGYYIFGRSVKLPEFGTCEKTKPKF